MVSNMAGRLQTAISVTNNYRRSFSPLPGVNGLLAHSGAFKGRLLRFLFPLAQSLACGGQCVQLRGCTGDSASRPDRQRAEDPMLRESTPIPAGKRAAKLEHFLQEL